MTNQTGKRYACASCGSELLVTRPGTGELTCCGQPMAIRGAQPAQQAASTKGVATKEGPRG